MKEKSPGKQMKIPDWYEGDIAPNSFRALFKWGDPNTYKHPNRGLVALMREYFGMSDTDFDQPKKLGLEPVLHETPSRLTSAQIEALSAIVGVENVFLDTFSRLRASYGKGMIDLLRLRNKIIENLPDAVIAPRSSDDVQALVTWCTTERIPMYVWGAGSSVTRGTEAVKGGITLDMSVHMQRVIAFNETDQTITVESGMWGPKLEDILNNAPARLGARRRYTCGHFPQSFEYSSVGGWVVTRGAGQNSTYYGKNRRYRHLTRNGDTRWCHPYDAPTSHGNRTGYRPDSDGL
jgi:alkyldihydroxyacetonephosphate synthase